MFNKKSQYICSMFCMLALGTITKSAFANSPLPGVPSAPLASKFAGPLWDVVTPMGGTASASNQHLFINVPGGSSHDALATTNQAVRVVQPIGNQDFDISIKIDSPIVATDADTSRGLMLLADNTNFITFALATDGTKLGLNVHTVTAGVTATVFQEDNFTEYQNPMYLRMTRTGAEYIAYYSVDGVAWTQATSFADSSVPTMIGPFAANSNPTPAHAVPVVMAVNWFNVQ
jgi:hypothetical protein